MPKKKLDASPLASPAPATQFSQLAAETQSLAPVRQRTNSISKAPERCYNHFCPTLNFTGPQQAAVVYHKLKLKDNSKVSFCKDCFEKCRKNQKCDFCFQVYYDSGEDADMDGKKWIGCSKCDKWNHTDCEVERAGTADSDMREIAKEFSKKQDE